MTTTEQTLEMSTATMADVALYFPQSIDLLHRYNLDYCCQGKMLFTEACRKANLEPEKVWDEVQNPSGIKRGGNPLNFENWNSSVLVDFIVQHHHEYVRESIPRITELLDKICSVHGDTNPELFAVRKDFHDLAEELLGHLPKEEQILFPAIKRIEGQPIASVESELEPTALAMPIHVMEDEHERAGSLIKSIRARTNQYAIPSYACPTYQLTLTMLQEFDHDLMQHIHLENNILFPRFKSIQHN
ncbi:MAG: iron-sulfur cluster repair di-iron protein [Bacteroidota bacterium]|jgi:regulator of cell morphogenesis and NO signaling